MKTKCAIIFIAQLLLLFIMPCCSNDHNNSRGNANRHDSGNIYADTSQKDPEIRDRNNEMDGDDYEREVKRPMDSTNKVRDKNHKQ